MNELKKEIKIFQSSYVYENIEIVEIDGVRMVRRLRDKKIIGLDDSSKRKKRTYVPGSRKIPRFQDEELRKELRQYFDETGISIGEFIKNSEILNYHLVWNFLNKRTPIALVVINEIKERIDANVCPQA